MGQHDSMLRKTYLSYIAWQRYLDNITLQRHCAMYLEYVSLMERYGCHVIDPRVTQSIYQNSTAIMDVSLGITFR